MENGIVSRRVELSVNQAVDRMTVLLGQKGIKLFALVDHSGEAASVGLAMPPTKLLIFGNPTAGTPLMLDAPSTALDLPLKILIAEESGGKTLISWNDPEYLHQRHGFPAELLSNIGAVGALVAALG